jgi:opacity protein-like surface antigen
MKKIFSAVALLATSALSATAADLGARPYTKAPPMVAAGCAYDIIRANSQIGVAFAATNMDYAEFNRQAAGGSGLPSLLPEGSRLNSERGWVPGVAVTASYMSDCRGAIPNLYVFGQGTFLNGKTDYYNYDVGVGAKDPARIWDGDFRVGKGFEIGPSTMITPYVGVGLHDWRRTISAVPSGPLIETYSHGYAGVGLLVQFAVAPRFVVSAYGLGGGTFNSEMGLNDTGLPARNHTFGLGNSEIVKAGASLDYAFTDQWHVNAGVDYTYFKYGASRQELLPTFGTYEPPSRTSNVTVTVGLGYSFGGPVVARY